VRLRALIAFATLSLSVFVSACSHQGDSLVLAGDGTRMSAEEIDRDPLALLPGGALGLAYVDAQEAYKSQMGASFASFTAAALPLGPDANFDARRDVTKAFIGFYSLQGVDVAAVIQGNFDPDAIKSSVSKGSPTMLGAPLTKLSYAGNDLYIAGDVGFVVVTRHTVIAGNDVGIRRTLDRIRDKKVRRDVSEWMVQLIETPKASMVGVADLSSQSALSALAQQAPFLNNLQVARVLGNFQAPGINFAGALTYPDAANAEVASKSVQQLAQLASWTSLLAIIGIRPPIQNMQVQVEKNDVQFIVSIDAQGASGILDSLSGAMRATKK